MLSILRSLWEVFRHVFAQARDDSVSRTKGLPVAPLSRPHCSDPRSRRRRTLCRLQSLRRGLSGGLYRAPGNGRRAWQEIPGILSHQLFPLHFLWLLRRSLPHICDSAHAGFRDGRVPRQNLVYEKDDLLIDGPGKYPDYNFWRVAGVAIGGKEKGQAEHESPSTPIA